MIKHTEEFKQEAVRIALTSGLPRDRVASDLGIGKSTLGKWVSQYRPSDLVSAPQADLARENERLRLENRVLREEREVPKKGHAVLREPKAVKFAFVHSWRHRWPVELLCRVMDVSERGYRSWRSRPISRRERTDMKVLAHIREQYRLSLGSYGRPRMTMELKEVGLDVGERRVGRLMKINGIKPVRTRKHKVTTDSHHRLGVAANWLDGDFAADAPNRKWAGDITYIWTSEGWLYLAVILDLHSRRVVGWAVSDRMKKDLAIRALDMAVRLRQPPEGCLFHSDRGSQYCSYDYQKKLQAYGLRPSMSGKGNCYDNASVETFFKSLKAELIWRQSWPTRRQAEAAIFQYINGFYNTRRRHSYLGGISPLAFEAKVA
ncbi:IS3 family transposase [Sphingobium phenoxybenzoativorans]|uniref:IS3 family transposase n=7 Tax=Alphaproteobacteria TaxID=28211 RepID=A0A975K8U6_9SPHN|nr:MULTISPECIES: IS3 family transposase [Sphingomonadaceae]QUT04506.1 IS3 family transposase [Sphingobium phenoxybenzoativorans]QUT05082.1 IS3 family transposase [Sphingobium phenoxybenzoativorans]QUT05350.1 IS3 family transposase [Sphingobium phenoxybenzoativorans]QUT05440.1 IS3 family transposase [Sphingobium phenoxybenzoativorans]QUT06840.1 IS3 family transposase [Sphingobium phenoxybenzoativorans]